LLRRYYGCKKILDPLPPPQISGVRPHSFRLKVVATKALLSPHCILYSKLLNLRELQFISHYKYISQQLPVATFKAPVATFKAPVATFKAPVATFKAPVATFKAPVATFKALVATCGEWRQGWTPLP
jgi:hypothetical protein